MEIIEMLDLGFVLDEKKFYDHIRMEQGSKRAAPIDRILSVAKNIPCPKVMYGLTQAKIIDDTHFAIEEVILNSKVGVEKIRKYSSVIPNIVTSGLEIEEYCLSMKNVLDQYIVMELCNFACEFARDAMKKDLKKQYKVEVMEFLYPGEDGFNLDSGKDIFSLFDGVKEKIGVTVSDMGLPTPSRTAYSLCFAE
ncbi:hypothetical protein Q5O14_14370 [Eubacteriaceae bacterium ES2]|nr:hypothetical protein Q5O14_14370 [Eubacteriaceae bacterium ES2]